MDKDDAFLKELQVNDKVKVTVNFFGQEMPFEGTCTGITDDKLSIQTSAKPEPVEFPLSAIIEGTITSKNKINIKESSEDNTYENLEIKYPEVVYGYYVVDLNNEDSEELSSKFTNNSNEFTSFSTLFNITTAAILLIKEFHTNTIINNLYNNNAFNLNNIKTFGDFCNNKPHNNNIDVLYEEYITSLDIFINKDRTQDNKLLISNLKSYLASIAYINKFYYSYPFDSEEEKLATNNRYFLSVMEIIRIIFTDNHYKEPEDDIKRYVETYHNLLFKYQTILKSLFKTTIYKIFNRLGYEEATSFAIKFFVLSDKLITDLRILHKKDHNLPKMIEQWYDEQVKKHNLFNPNLLETNITNITFDSPVLIPITSFDNLSQSTKYTLFKLMRHLYISDSKLLYITVSNNEFRERLTNYIRNKYNSEYDLSSSIKNIFRKFTASVNYFFFNLIEICNIFVSITFYVNDYKNSYSIINEKTNLIIHSLEHEADKYITVTAKFNNRLKSFF